MQNVKHGKAWDVSSKGRYLKGYTAENWTAPETKPMPWGARRTVKTAKNWTEARAFEAQGYKIIAWGADYIALTKP